MCRRSEYGASDGTWHPFLLTKVAMHAAASDVRAIISCALILAAGCTQPTDPDDSAFMGTFVLQAIDRVPVPVLQGDYTFTRDYLLADTIWADGRGRYTRVTITATDSVDRPFRAIQRQTAAGAYQVIHGDTLAFPFVCPPGASCIFPPVGWRVDNIDWAIARLRLTTGFAQVSLFRRVE